jgi:NAD(P)H-dependent flavin oxidoreductase YrpB (nitropropane dioxygenase family)
MAADMTAWGFPAGGIAIIIGATGGIDVRVPVICQVQTVAMALDAVRKGADIVVAQGSEAGGHGCSRGTFALVPAVVDAVGPDTIVVAAGGVADGRGLAAALLLGAQGVVLGTRFLASDEAAGHPNAKERLVAASGDETLRGLVFDISRRNVWPAPFTGRCLLNDHARRWQGRELELLRHVHEEGEQYLAARAAGDFDVAAVIAGEAVDLVSALEPAGTIVRRIVTEAEALLSGTAAMIPEPTQDTGVENSPLAALAIYSSVFEGCWDGRGWQTSAGLLCDPTHWMPMPSPPLTLVRR